MMKNKTPLTTALLVLAMLLMPAQALSVNINKKININVIDMEISEVMAMLSAKENVNIMVNTGVSGTISLNLYRVSIDDVVRFAAKAGGFATEYSNGTYFIVKPEDVGSRYKSDITDVRSYTIRYSDPDKVKTLLEEYVSDYGKVTALKDRNMIVVEDTIDHLKRIDDIMTNIDATPMQILIEAKILVITLNDSDAYGINWSSVFSDGENTISSTLTAPTTGLSFNRVTPDIDITLSALLTDDRVRTLSSPNLVTVANKEASVIIGDRQGYKVTTTINQVTTESVEFLESGVILRVTPTVDDEGMIMMSIHPEVSNGVISPDGIPSQTTTEVTTDILTTDGESIFIGGLIKNNIVEGTESVPLLGAIPILGSLFSSETRSSINTETVVLITPYVIGGEAHQDMLVSQREAFDREQKKMLRDSEERKQSAEEEIESMFYSWAEDDDDL